MIQLYEAERVITQTKHGLKVASDLRDFLLQYVDDFKREGLGRKIHVSVIIRAENLPSDPKSAKKQAKTPVFHLGTTMKG